MTVIDYMITPRCNLNCPFCYGSTGVSEMSLKQKKQIIKEISLFGITHVIISGGEPLSSPDIVDVCSFAKKNGLKVAVQTNGTYLSTLKKILPFVDWIALPIDGISTYVCEKTRTLSSHFAVVEKSIQVIEDYKKTNNTDMPAIKIGTVLTKHNISDIFEIYSYLTKHQISVWKIYKIRRRGKMVSEDAYNAIYTPDDVIKKISNKINQLPSKFKIYFSENLTNDSYVIIEPNTDIVVINGSSIHTCGTLFTNNGFNISALKMAMDIVDKEKICKNINESFPKWQQ